MEVDVCKDHKKEIILICLNEGCELKFLCVNCISFHNKVFRHEPILLEKRFVFASSLLNSSSSGAIGSSNTHVADEKELKVDLSNVVEYYKPQFKKALSLLSKNTKSELLESYIDITEVLTSELKKAMNSFLERKDSEVDLIIEALNKTLNNLKEQSYLDSNYFLDSLIRREKELKSFFATDKEKMFFSMRSLKFDFLDKIEIAVENVAQREETIKLYKTKILLLKEKYISEIRKLCKSFEEESKMIFTDEEFKVRRNCSIATFGFKEFMGNLNYLHDRSKGVLTDTCLDRYLEVNRIESGVSDGIEMKTKIDVKENKETKESKGIEKSSRKKDNVNVIKDGNSKEIYYNTSNSNTNNNNNSRLLNQLSLISPNQIKPINQIPIITTNQTKQSNKKIKSIRLIKTIMTDFNFLETFLLKNKDKYDNLSSFNKNNNKRAFFDPLSTSVFIQVGESTSFLFQLDSLENPKSNISLFQLKTQTTSFLNCVYSNAFYYHDGVNLIRYCLLNKKPTKKIGGVCKRIWSETDGVYVYEDSKKPGIVKLHPINLTVLFKILLPEEINKPFFCFNHCLYYYNTIGIDGLFDLIKQCSVSSFFIEIDGVNSNSYPELLDKLSLLSAGSCFSNFSSDLTDLGGLNGSNELMLYHKNKFFVFTVETMK